MATDPQPSLTLWQRLMADAPAFWKKIQLFGLVLGGAVATAATQIPPEYLTPQVKLWLGVVAGIATCMVGLSQMAVKDASVLENHNATLQDLVNAIPDLKQQITDLHGAVVTTVQDAVQKGKIDVPAADIPVVTEAPQVTVSQAVAAADAVPSDPLTFQQAVDAEVAKRLANQ